MKIRSAPIMLASLATLTLSACVPAGTNQSQTIAKSEVTKPADSITNALQKISNMEIIEPDNGATVQLKDGAGSFPIAPDSEAKGIVQILPDLTATWKGKKRTDLLVVAAVNSGGSGTFRYLMLFDISGETPLQKSNVGLGDRVKIQDIEIGELVHSRDANYRVSVKLLNRSESEPMSATPTIEEKLTFYVINQKLEEVTSGDDDT